MARPPKKTSEKNIPSSIFANAEPSCNDSKQPVIGINKPLTQPEHLLSNEKEDYIEPQEVSADSKPPEAKPKPETKSETPNWAKGTNEYGTLFNVRVPTIVVQEVVNKRYKQQLKQLVMQGVPPAKAKQKVSKREIVLSLIIEAASAAEKKDYSEIVFGSIEDFDL